jgi:hypothetical protein
MAKVTQRWNMFSDPKPFHSRVPLAVGTLANGSECKIGLPSRWQWICYCASVQRSRDKKRRLQLESYLCKEWNKSHEDSNLKLSRVSLTLIKL